jgi:hypothetical protein
VLARGPAAAREPIDEWRGQERRGEGRTLHRKNLVMRSHDGQASGPGAAS